MFGGKETQRNAAAVDTLIGRQTEIHGDVRFAGGLHLDGTIKGKVIADGNDATLSVAETGRVEGDVRVPNLVLNGVVEGDVHTTQRITISGRGRVNGNVYYKVIEMSSGATINGQMVHESREPAAITHDKQRKVTQATSADDTTV